MAKNDKEESVLSGLFGDDIHEKYIRNNPDLFTKYKVTGKKSGKSAIITESNKETAEDAFFKKFGQEKVIVEEIFPKTVCFSIAEVEHLVFHMMGNSMDLKKRYTEQNVELDKFGKEQIASNEEYRKKFAMLRRKMKSDKKRKICIRLDNYSD